MPSLIRISSLGVRFGEHRVLEKWNMEICQGERVVLLGQSGCGKTTFLKVLGGIVKPSEGSLQGVPSRVGFVFQEPRLIPWATVAKNLNFVSPSCSVEELLERVHLSGWGQAYPRELSGGMQQRVNLARALGVEPELLLLDEAFGSLDLRHKFSIMEDLLDFWKRRNCTILMVTHDITEALYLGDRILFLEGTPSRIAGEMRVDLPRDRSPWSREFLEYRGVIIRRFLEVPEDQDSKFRNFRKSS